jgi:hypothetical protein
MGEKKMCAHCMLALIQEKVQSFVSRRQAEQQRLVRTVQRIEHVERRRLARVYDEVRDLRMALDWSNLSEETEKN